ncbi:MAG: succinate dehydrogenase assembly factor 2 [Roseiarcus sp.]
MTNSNLSSDGLDPRRRRILFRCRRRGVREMDLAFSAFADAHLPTLSDAELDELERWLDVPDPQILSWITGQDPTPASYDTPLFAKLRSSPGDAYTGGTPAT